MKSNNEKLIQIAQKALIANNDIWIENEESILDSYNGQIAALSVTIALSDLRPALAIYYQDKLKAETKPKACRRIILDLIASMISIDNEFPINPADSKSLLCHAIDTDSTDLKKLKKEVIDCAIALKQVVRTYNLVSK